MRHTCRPHLIVASDLHTKHPAIKMPKYADDMYLMFGTNKMDPISEEFANSRSWATLNDLRTRPNKTKDMIIYRRRNKMALPPTCSTIVGAERVYSMRVLGVTFNQHASNYVRSCSD